MNKYWRENAACADLSVAELFEAPLGQSITFADEARYRKAFAFCVACPVKMDCATDPTTQKSEGFRHGALWVHRRHRGDKPVSIPWRAIRHREIIVLESRICTRCWVEKPIEEFWRDNRKPTGHRSECIDCGVDRDRER